MQTCLYVELLNPEIYKARCLKSHELGAFDGVVIFPTGCHHTVRIASVLEDKVIQSSLVIAGQDSARGLVQKLSLSCPSNKYAKLCTYSLCFRGYTLNLPQCLRIKVPYAWF